MTMKFSGSKTEKSLLAAFAGESQARNRYTFFASVAKKEGYEQIAAIFLQTAEEEKEHGKLFFKHLKGGDVEITAAYPAGVIGTTVENLAAAAAGEQMEWGTLYPKFAAIAEKEGFKDIAYLQDGWRSGSPSRGTVRETAYQPGKRNPLQIRDAGEMVLPELRVCPRG